MVVEEEVMVEKRRIGLEETKLRGLWKGVVGLWRRVVGGARGWWRAVDMVTVAVVGIGNGGSGVVRAMITM